MEQLLDTTNKQQMQAYDLIANTNSCFFLTGRAGTGKTTFLHNVQKMTNKQFVIFAPTGVAAILAGGETIHSFFGLPLEVCAPGTCGTLNEERILTLIHTDTIIIDEVSMVRCDIIDTIDYTLRKTLRTTHPFGGKQIVFMGDMFQLEPIVKYGPERELLHDIYNTDDYYFYKANVMKRLRMVTIEFKKVYRQEDSEFLHILEDVRMNRVTNEDIVRLNEHVNLPKEGENMIITLTSQNSTADKINNQHLDEIKSEEYVYEGSISGKFEEKRFPVEQRLRLKVGAQIMFTRNDPLRRWANGTLATVSSLTKDSIYITIGNKEETVIVPCCSWDSVSYEYDRKERKLKKQVTGSFTQYPIRLAWAITVHKSQGMTFEKLSLNLSKGLFAAGQLYVALSRVRSLDGLYLSDEVIPQYAYTNKEIIQFASGFNNEQAINNEIENGKAVYEALRTNDSDEAAKCYLRLVHKYAAIGNIKEAMQISSRLLDTVVEDDDLLGCIDNVPSNLLNLGHWAPQFLVALFSLYSCQYEQGLRYANKVLSLHRCEEALFIRSRCLAEMGRYEESDSTNVELANIFDMDMPNAKVLYMIAMLNEEHMGEPGLDYMRKLVAIKPKYNRAILALRYLMKKHDINLSSQNGENCELVIAFNSNISQSDFSNLLKDARKRAPRAVSYLHRAISKQNFEE